MSEQRLRAEDGQWRALRDLGKPYAFEPLAVADALPGTRCGVSLPQLLSCHALLGRVMVLTQSSTSTADQRPVTEEEITAATTLIRSFGSYLERVYPEPGDRSIVRYHFEVDEGNTSASGVLRINRKNDTMCLDVQARNIKASHLLWMDPDRADARGTVVLTFFDPYDDELGTNLPPSGTHCFAHEQLDDLRDDGLLARLMDSPDEFRLDFHRGPDDEPGLVAELMTAEEAFAGTTYVDEEDQVSVHVPSGWHVAPESLTPNLDDPREILSLGTAPMPIGGDRCDHQPENALESMGPVDVFVSIQERDEAFDYPPRPESFKEAAEASQDQFESCAALEDIQTYWLAFRDEGRNFYLLAAVGESAYRGGDELWEVVESLDFSLQSATDDVRTKVSEFMEARVEGEGAEEFLGAAGWSGFAPSRDLARPLYPKTLRDFRIEFIDDLGDGTSEVGVTLISEERTYGETLFVRESGDSFVVAGVRPGLKGP